MRDVTLVFLRSEDNVLLGLKKRGFGANKWNGFGGKVHGEETILQSAARELHEEIGVVVSEDDLAAVGSIEFVFDHDDSWNQRAHVFFVTTWQGTPTESDEMIPQWFSLSEIPYEQMWIDDQYWLPQALRTGRVQAKFVFSEQGAVIREMELR